MKQLVHIALACQILVAESCHVVKHDVHASTKSSPVSELADVPQLLVERFVSKAMIV